MRKTLLIPAILLGALMTVSCERNPRTIDEQDDYIEIRLVPKSVDISTSPLTRSGDDDLYGVEILKDGEVYACWLTDNLSSSPIRLLKSKTYNVHVMYVPNGKNILYKSGNYYGNPFFHLGPLNSPEFGHGIYYGGNYDMNYGSFGAAQVKSKNTYFTQANAWNDVDIYYGFKQVSADSDTDINVNLYRQMFGLEVTATNFTNGVIHVYSGNAGQSYEEAKANQGNVFDLTPSSPRIDKVLELFYMPWCHFNFIMTTEEEVANWGIPYCDDPVWYDQLRIAYTTPDGETLELVSQKFQPKRMTKYSISINVDELVQEYYGTLSSTVVNSEWSTESINL